MILVQIYIRCCYIQTYDAFPKKKKHDIGLDGKYPKQQQHGISMVSVVTIVQHSIAVVYFPKKHDNIN